MTDIRVSALYVYPIKSCGAVRLEEAQVVAGGLQFDRRYMIVDKQGQFITARSEPRLLQVEVKLDGSSATLMCATHPAMQTELRLEATGPLVVQELVVSVWRDQPRVNRHADGSDWFSRYLGYAVELVFLPDHHLRQVNLGYAALGDVVSLADGYPLLLTSETSLGALNDRLEVPIGMHRFRPNVVVSGATPFDEDIWANLTIGSQEFEAPKLCDRCVITTLEAATARKSKEPLRTLASFRKWNGGVWFGTNLIPRAYGLLKVGEPVQVLRTREHPRLSVTLPP